MESKRRRDYGVEKEGRGSLGAYLIAFTLRIRVGRRVLFIDLL